MPVIHLQTLIDAPRARVFDLARSIDAHQASAKGTGERALAGVTSGLLAQGEEVTWEARHLGVKQRLTSRMTKLTHPQHFQDVMVKGVFKHLCHDHTFEDRAGKTLMTDRFEFRAPLGILGTLAELVFLTSYMRRFLEQRNRTLQQMAESDEWRKYLR